jgi:hypothetical protein
MTPLCYCCDQTATTAEHVPPQCLFPQNKDLKAGLDLRRNLITVPSCEEHNLGKAGDDEYLMYVLSMNLPAGIAGVHQFSTKVTRAIQRRPALARSVLSQSTPVILHNPASSEPYETLAVKVDERLERTLEKVALGLHRHHFGASWPGLLRVIPEFIRFTEGEQAPGWNQALKEVCGYADRLFVNVPFCGDNPSIFQYQAVSATPDGPAALRMHFYGGCRVLAVYGAAGG